MSNLDKPTDKPLDRPKKPAKSDIAAALVKPSVVKPKLELVQLIQPSQANSPVSTIEPKIESKIESQIEPEAIDITQDAEVTPLDLDESQINQLDNQIETYRNQPISPVTDLMQYRAIGVVYGTYIPEAEVLTKGIIVTTDGTEIEAVLLGKVIAVVKKRLDLAKEHCWVVYPRTRTKTGILHLQVTGVWAPEELGKIEQTDDPGVNDGYFSIRGEVVSQSFDQNLVMIKILRKDRTKTLDRNQAKFKLQLTGTLPNHPVGYFWEINARRSQDTLEIVDGHSIAPIFHRSRLNKQSKEVIFKPKSSSDPKSTLIPKSQRQDRDTQLNAQKPESIKRESPILKKPQSTVNPE
jgi:hypothetical protein